jgi:hypothetical protein
LDFFQYFIQHCFICRPSDSTVSEEAGSEPRTTAWLSDRRSNHSARSHPLTRSHPQTVRSHPIQISVRKKVNHAKTKKRNGGERHKSFSDQGGVISHWSNKHLEKKRDKLYVARILKLMQKIY